MARQRFIWPTLWTDPTVARLEPGALLLFIGCFSNADDDGRLLGDPAYLKSTVFPYQTFTVDYVRELRDAMVAACNHVTLYAHDGVELLAFRKWSEYQKPRFPKPSKLPPPPVDKPRRRRRQAKNVTEAATEGPTEAASTDHGSGFGRTRGGLDLDLGSTKTNPEPEPEPELRPPANAAGATANGAGAGSGGIESYEDRLLREQAARADHNQGRDLTPLGPEAADPLARLRKASTP